MYNFRTLLLYFHDLSRFMVYHCNLYSSVALYSYHSRTAPDAIAATLKNNNGRSCNSNSTNASPTRRRRT